MGITKAELERLAAEERRRYMRDWREKNREHLREYNRRWKSENKEKLAESKQKYWEHKALERLAKEKAVD